MIYNLVRLIFLARILTTDPMPIHMYKHHNNCLDPHINLSLQMVSILTGLINVTFDHARTENWKSHQMRRPERYGLSLTVYRGTVQYQNNNS